MPMTNAELDQICGHVDFALGIEAVDYTTATHISTLVAEIRRLQALVPRWTSVEDGLPTEGDYLVCVVDENYIRFLISACFRHNAWHPDTGEHDEKLIVTHWTTVKMPVESRSNA